MAERRIDGKWRIGGKMAEMAENGGTAETAERRNPPFSATNYNIHKIKKNTIKNFLRN
jgi:hypothetical protein